MIFLTISIVGNRRHVDIRYPVNGNDVCAVSQR